MMQALRSIEAFSDFPEKDKLVPRLASAQQVVDDVMPVLDRSSHCKIMELSSTNTDLLFKSVLS